MNSDIQIKDLNVSEQEAQHFINCIGSTPGFPKEGIIFRDFMPVLADAQALQTLMHGLEEALPVPAQEFDVIAGLESRGFLIGVPLALRLGKGFVAIRKAGKLPPPTIAASYELEYGTATIEIEQQAIASGSRVLVVDDLIATGGTAQAAQQLIEASGASVAGFSFVMELTGIDIPDTIKQSHYSSLVTMPA